MLGCTKYFCHTFSNTSNSVYDYKCLDSAVNSTRPILQRIRLDFGAGQLTSHNLHS